MSLRPLSLCIAALGGQGGGVIADWLVGVARREDYLAQATSVPGVAQRTGATIYYLEFFPNTAKRAGRTPVFALMPDSGDVDVLVAAELLEAGRSMERGLLTADRTTLITSTHREYSLAEKSVPGDARFDSDAILAAVRRQSRRTIEVDVPAIAQATRGHLSTVLFGIIAASGVLPFKRESFKATLAASAFATSRNLAAFQAGMAAADSRKPPADAARGMEDFTRAHKAPLPAEHGLPLSAQLRPIAERIAAECAPEWRDVAALGVRRLIDYQDLEYASLYLDRLRAIGRVARSPVAAIPLMAAIARALALWMSFEDTFRVADIKTHASRHARIAHDVAAEPGELVEIAEYLKPRLEEICGSLPAWLGRRVLASPRLSASIARLAKGRRISTTHIGGFLFLRGLSILRRWRRGTLRFVEEDARIWDWMDLIVLIVPRDQELALEVVLCQELVRGYGETHHRGCTAFTRIAQRATQLVGNASAAAQVRTLREAALADADGTALDALLPRLVDPALVRTRPAGEGGGRRI
jgi:indolepyruvate ferredoxin oxidoreductase beta subunit